MSLTMSSIVVGRADATLLALAVVAPSSLYLVGLRRLRSGGSRAVGAVAGACGVTGLATVGVALNPALAGLSEESFAAHMTQHLALGLVAPLLVVLGRVGEVVPWAIAPSPRAALRRQLRHRFPSRPSAQVAGGALVVVWYTWHIPGAYRLAAESPAIHAAEHASFLFVGYLLWSSVAPHRRKTGPTIFALFGVTLATGLLGAMLSLSPVPFYGSSVAAVTEAARLDDQHLGGLLMWTPGGLVYLLATVVQLVRWLDVGADRIAPRGFDRRDDASRARTGSAARDLPTQAPT